MSETPDEEVDYGVADIVENPHIVTGYEWSASSYTRRWYSVERPNEKSKSTKKNTGSSSKYAYK